jgi:hypothetical protein
MLRSIPGRCRRVARRAFLGASLGSALLVFSGHASAYTIESPFTAGCHEAITSDALRAVRGELPTAPAIVPTRDELAFIDDLPFTLDDDVRDLGGAALLAGVRHNDIKSFAVLSIDQLAQVQSDPLTQREHCLRSASEDEPGGTEASLLDCRTYIRERVLLAMDGLGHDGRPDPTNRVSIALTLAVRGLVSASLPVFYFRMGQGIHALQDSFTHSFRSADGTHVAAALNYIDLANGTIDEQRDGPPHNALLDSCDDADPLLARNHHLAIAASAELLHAALDPKLDRAEKERVVDDVLNRYLTFEPGCDAANGWCDAAENKVVGSACGCGIPGSPAGSGVLGLGTIGLTLMLMRRAAKRARRARVGALSLVAAAMIVGGSSTAQAQPATAAATPAPVAAPTTLTAAELKANAKVDAPVAPPPEPGEAPRVVARLVSKESAKTERAEHDRSAFSVYIAASGSVVNPAIAGALAARWQLNDAWVLGVDAEWNPYYGVQTRSFRMGSFNGYATLIRRFPLRFESVNLRTTAHLGTSVLLMDLYGAPRGSTGIFMGIAPLGIEWKVSRALYVIIDPINLAVAAPQLAATPFVYQQYRFTIGIELAPW